MLQVVGPAAERNRLNCIQVDPLDYGMRDEELFNLLRDAEVAVFDMSAASNDYFHSLGVRHALSDKPTFILVERNETEPLPFDVIVPRGIIHYPSDLRPERASLIMDHLSERMREAIRDLGTTRYSPVRDALNKVPRVFLSYAHGDREAVAAVDQWLRDKGVRVDIDERDFVAGRDLRDEIVRVIRNAGKVVCFYSKNAHDRYFTKLERRIAEEQEKSSVDQTAQRTITIYFRLDTTELPLESSHRLAVNAWQMGFEEACKNLWRHLLEESGMPKRVPLSRYRKKAPW